MGQWRGAKSRHPARPSGVRPQRPCPGPGCGEAAPDGSPHCEPPPAEPGGQGPPGGQRWSTAQTLDPGAPAAVCPQARGSPSLGGSCSSVERGDGSGWGPGRTATALLAPSSRYRRRRGREVDDRLSQGLPQHQRRLRVPSWLRALQHPGALSVSVRPPSSRLSVLPPRGLRRRLDPQPVCPLRLGRLHPPPPAGARAAPASPITPPRLPAPPPPPRPSSGPSGWAVSSWARDRSREQTGAPSITAGAGHDPLRGPWGETGVETATDRSGRERWHAWHRAHECGHGRCFLPNP